MELYVTYHKILDLLQQFQESNPVLKSFGYGNLVEFGDNVSGRTTQYPFFYVVPQSIAYDQNTTTYQLSLLFADRLNEDKDNEKDAVSDMSLVARDFISQVMRGNLMEKMDMVMPVNAIPFMERFNDYVAGVALDAQLIIFEDVNACVEYPTPTPSATPSSTPIPVTPSETPTNTPTVTPTITPSPTNIVVNPATLSALWWSQYSNDAFLNLQGPAPNYVMSVIDGVNGSTYFTPSAVLGPYYQDVVFSSCTLNFSGGVTNASFSTPLVSQTGDYPLTPEYTFFSRFYLSSSPTGFYFNLLNSDTVTGQANRWLVFRFNRNNAPNPYEYEFDIWTDPANDAGFMNLQNTYTSTDQWVNLCFRAYQDGPDFKIRLQDSNGLDVSNTAFGTIATAPPTDQAFVQGIPFGFNTDYLAEQFWFNRKLSDSEVADMFNYLNNKYC